MWPSAKTYSFYLFPFITVDWSGFQASGSGSSTVWIHVSPIFCQVSLQRGLMADGPCGVPLYRTSLSKPLRPLCAALIVGALTVHSILSSCLAYQTTVVSENRACEERPPQDPDAQHRVWSWAWVSPVVMGEEREGHRKTTTAMTRKLSFSGGGSYPDV